MCKRLEKGAGNGQCQGMQPPPMVLEDMKNRKHWLETVSWVESLPRDGGDCSRMGKPDGTGRGRKQYKTFRGSETCM